MKRRSFLQALLGFVAAAMTPAAIAKGVKPAAFPAFNRETAGKIRPGIGMDLSETALEDAIVEIQRMTVERGIPFAVSPRYLVLVPSEASRIATARAIVGEVESLRKKCSFVPVIEARVEPDLAHFEWAVMAEDGRTVLTDDASGERVHNVIEPVMLWERPAP